jgi:hypothetical protein
MLYAILDCLSDLARLDVEDDGEHDEDTDQHKLSSDIKPNRVQRKISEMLQLCMERFQHKQMKHDKLAQLG